MAISLYDYQMDAVRRMKNGCVLCGGVGSGKSRTALAYYFFGHGGKFENGRYSPMTEPRDLYIITTARKRDTKEWEGECVSFLLSSDKKNNPNGNNVVVDSWNNIGKYSGVRGAFFIFDEQRVVGSGAWVRAFLKIAKANEWILLSATPGDTWQDYIPVFVANGFYRNRTEFKDEHMIITWINGKYPKIDGYRNVGKLMRHRDDILINMAFERGTVSHHIPIYADYDIKKYRELGRSRWNPYKNEPIINASELCYLWRKVANSDVSRQVKLLEIFEDHPRIIVFYNFDYELDILKSLGYGDAETAEWNGHRHQPIPDSESWVYFVQYTAGAEGWNCIATDTVIFWSQNYSYKVMAQSAGRIDRLNTPYKDLYYYHLKSKAPIDIAIGRALDAKKDFNEKGYLNRSSFA